MQISKRALLIGALACLLSGAALAQNYWSQRSVTVVTPYGAGAATDSAVRIFLPAFANALGTTVRVENRAGSGGGIGVAAVARANADGFTMGAAGLDTLAQGPAARRRQLYDPVADFKFVCLAFRQPLLLVVSTDSPIKNFDDFLAASKRRLMRYGHTGYGSGSYMAAVQFNLAASVPGEQIPYLNSSQDALIGLFRDDVQYLFLYALSALPQVQGGKVRALAVLGPQRLVQLPDVPSIAERSEAFKTLDLSYWTMFVVPKATPDEIVDSINAACRKALSDPAVVAALGNAGVSAFPDGERTRSFAQSFFSAESAKWMKLIKDQKIEID